MRIHLCGLAAFAMAAACQGPPSTGKPSWERLQRGMRVEAEGPFDREPPVATEIEEKEPEPNAAAERFEVTGPVALFEGPSSFVVVGHRVFV